MKHEITISEVQKELGNYEKRSRNHQKKYKLSDKQIEVIEMCLMPDEDGQTYGWGVAYELLHDKYKGTDLHFPYVIETLRRLYRAHKKSLGEEHRFHKMDYPGNSGGGVCEKDLEPYSNENYSKSIENK